MVFLAGGVAVDAEDSHITEIFGGGLNAATDC